MTSENHIIYLAIIFRCVKWDIMRFIYIFLAWKLDFMGKKWDEADGYPKLIGKTHGISLGLLAIWWPGFKGMFLEDHPAD